MTVEVVDYFETYYSLNKRLLRLIGVWPRQEPKLQSFIIFSVYFFYFSGLLLESYEICNQRLNMKTFMIHLHYVTPAFCGFVCYSAAVLQPKLLVNIIDRVRIDSMMIEDDREIVMFKKYFGRSRMGTWIISIMLYTYYVLMILPSIFNVFISFGETINSTQIILPVPFGHFVDTKAHYYGILSYQIILVLVIVTVMTATYTSYLSIIQHAYFLQDIVILKINEPFGSVRRKNQLLFSDPSNFGYDWMIGVIKSYMNALEFIRLLNCLSGTAFFFEVIAATLIITTSFFYLSELYDNKSSDVTEVLKCSVYSCSGLFIVYLSSYVGQMVIDHNTAIYTELRQIPFYEISLKAQKLLPFVIMRSTHPCGLTIAGAYISSHEFFLGLIQTALQYAMVCHAMR